MGWYDEYGYPDYGYSPYDRASDDMRQVIEDMEGKVKPAYTPYTPTFKARSEMLFIAVVFAERHGSAFSPGLKLDSAKGHGGWESFIGKTRNEAVKKALAARDKWDTSPVDGKKYVVFVGQLTERVVSPPPVPAYELVSL